MSDTPPKPLPRTDWAKSRFRQRQAEPPPPRIATPGGFLRQLFDVIFKELHITPQQFGRMVDDYMDSRIGTDDHIKRDSRQAQLLKALRANEITFKTIVKGFQILKWCRIRVTITGFRADGTSTMHSLDMHLPKSGGSEDLKDD